MPDPDFSTLRDVTNLLVNHDFGPTANYKPASITQFSLKVDGVPKRAPGPAASTEDRGNAVMEDAIGEFKAERSSWATQRQETSREFIKNKTVERTVSVDLYELYWADLSRPKSFSIFNAFVAFLSLLFNACSLGRKSLEEAIYRLKQPDVGCLPPTPGATKPSAELSLLQALSFIQYMIEQMLTAVLPSVNLWVAGAGLTYYLLTLRQDVHDAVVPTVLGFLAMGAYLVHFANQSPPKAPWQRITFICLCVGIVVCFFAFLSGTQLKAVGWLSAVACGIWATGIVMIWYFYRPDMRRFWLAAGLVSAAAIALLIYELVERIGVPNLWSENYPATAWKSMVLLWCDWICAGLSLLWAILAVLNLSFLGLLAVLPLTAKKDTHWDRTLRAVWTACVANTAPGLILLVLTLGCWQIVTWSLGVRAGSTGIPNHYILPIHYCDWFLGFSDEVQRASKLWYHACRHPWIQFAFLWFIVVSVFLVIAIAPNVRLEIRGVKKGSSGTAPDGTTEEASWVGKATDGFYQALGLSGSIIAKLMGILAPLVLWGVAWFHESAVQHNAIDDTARDVIRVLATLYFVITVGWHFLRRQQPVSTKDLFFVVLNAFVTAVSILAVTLQFVLNIVWALPLSALFVLAGVAFVFKTILDAALDVVNWLRVTPRDNNPRGQIIARLTALMGKITHDYDALVILAHSQGTIIVVEYLRYLEFIGQVPEIQTSLFTVGCPLRQLYSARFPDVYSWVGNNPEQAQAKLMPPFDLNKWLNGYTTGDYIGRNLWCQDAQRDVPAENPTSFGNNREEICFGVGAHIHYFDWRFDGVAKQLDNLIVAAASHVA